MQNADPIKRQLHLFTMLYMNSKSVDVSYTNWDELGQNGETNIFNIEKSKSAMKNIPSYYKLQKKADCDEVKAELSRGSLLLKDDINALREAGINISQKRISFKEKPTSTWLSWDTEIEEEMLEHKKAYTIVFHQYQTMFEFENIVSQFTPKTTGAIKLRRLIRIIYDMLTFETNYSYHIQLMFNKTDYIEQYCDESKTSEALRKQLSRDLSLFAEIGIVVKKFKNDIYIISAPRDEDYWQDYPEEEWENLENDFKECGKCGNCQINFLKN